MKWYFEVLKKYATFSGRAQRKEFWYFLVWNTVISLVIGLLSSLLGWSFFNVVPMLSSVYALFVLIPSLAVTVRRLHDTNRSGRYFFLHFLLPVVGTIMLFVFFEQDSDENENRYGPNPKATTE